MKRTHRARLNRVGVNVEKALDSLHRAQGELRPVELRSLADPVGRAIKLLDDTLKAMGDMRAEQPQPDDGQLDIEDRLAGLRAEDYPVTQGPSNANDQEEERPQAGRFSQAR